MKIVSYVILLIMANFLAWRLGEARTLKDKTARERAVSLVSLAVGFLSGIFYTF